MLYKLLALSVFAIPVSAAAFADRDFCGGIPDCRKVKISNEAAVVVTSVTITQQPTDGVCTKDKRKFSQNVRSADESLNAEAFNIFANPNCKYKIKYSTTAGCIGDKTGYLTPRKFADLADYVALKKSCGRLKVKVS